MIMLSIMKLVSAFVHATIVYNLICELVLTWYRRVNRYNAQ